MLVMKPVQVRGYELGSLLSVHQLGKGSYLFNSNRNILDTCSPQILPALNLCKLTKALVTLA